MTDFILDDFLPYVLAVTASQVSENFAKIYRDTHGISRAQWRIICHLARSDEGLSIRDLQAEIHLEKSKTSRAVSTMQKNGLVQKSTHTKDARLLAIVLTPKGREIFDALAPLAVEYQEKLEQKLTRAELTALRSALKKLAYSGR